MTYAPRHQPYAHQVEALARLEGKEDFALLMEMRTGKSFVLLTDYGRMELTGKVQNLMVIAPGGVYRTWLTAIADHLSDDLQRRGMVHAWTSGAGKRGMEERRLFMGAAAVPRILLMNIEALSSVAEARALAQGFLTDGPAMLAIDESTVIKGPTTKRTEFVNRKLAPLARYRRILSGLPTPRSPLDLFSQFEFLNPRILGFRSFYAFRNRYAIMQRVQFGGRQVPVIKGYRDTDDLQRRIAPHSYRKLLAECTDLPPKHYVRREVLLTSEQKRIYKDLKTFATAALSATEHVTATIVIAQILRLHQVLCGHTADELGKVHEIPENRTAELLELLDDYSGKAIVWCSYGHDIEKVSAALAKDYGPASVARFWGGNAGAREQEERQFLSDPACRWMVATPAAGGRGRTWTVADLVVYYSNTHDLEHRSQSEERAQGIGKARPVTYVDLVAPGTVDDKIIAALRSKIDMASAITGDAYREWLV